MLWPVQFLLPVEVIAATTSPTRRGPPESPKQTPPSEFDSWTTVGLSVVKDETDERRTPSNVNVRAALAGVGVMAGGIAIAIALATIVSSRVPSPRAAPNNAERPAIAGAVQRTDPAAEREALTAAARRRLASSGVDPKTGRRYIPIEEAMRILAHVDERQ